MIASFMQLSEFAATAHYYRFLRERYPLVPAGKVHDFLKGDDGRMSFEEYAGLKPLCSCSDCNGDTCYCDLCR